MKKIFILLLVLISTTADAGVQDVLFECDSNPSFIGSRAKYSSYSTVMETYIGDITPSEWAACKTSAPLTTARTNKKEEIKNEAERRAKLIDEDFSLNNIGIYKKISVAALDADGVSIRSVLIYAKQKMAWVETASTQDINSYDPTTDVGWP
jgi:hypothetical protein